MTSLTQWAFDDSEVVLEIYNKGLELKPAEACGVLVENRGECKVVSLPNRATNPNAEFAISGKDLKLTLGKDFEFDAIYVWHTHPAGGVGPSRTDLQHSKGYGINLVVALTEDGPRASIY